MFPVLLFNICCFVLEPYALSYLIPTDEKSIAIETVSMKPITQSLEKIEMWIGSLSES